MSLARQIAEYEKGKEYCREMAEKLGKELNVQNIPNYNGEELLYQVAEPGFIFGVSQDISGVGKTPKDAMEDYLRKSSG